MKPTIVIIDDKTHALIQIKASFPAERIEDFSFHHFESFREYSRSTLAKPDLLFLDFFLDQDRQPGTAFLGQIETKYLIGFSSMLQCSRAIFEEAMHCENFNGENTF